MSISSNLDFNKLPSEIQLLVEGYLGFEEFEQDSKPKSSNDDFNKLPSVIQQLVGGYLNFEEFEQDSNPEHNEYWSLSKVALNPSFIRTYFRDAFNQNLSALNLTYSKLAQITSLYRSIDCLNLSYSSSTNHSDEMDDWKWLKRMSQTTEIPPISREELDHIFSHSPQLKKINISKIYLSEDLSSLFQKYSPIFNELEELNISNNRTPLSFEVLKHIKTTKLRVLRYGNNSLSSKQVTQISLLCPTVTYLDLTGNYLLAKGAKALSENCNFRSVTYLDLEYNGIINKGAIEIAKSTQLVSLEILCLGHNIIELSGVKAFANTVRLPNLKRLNLQFNRFSLEEADSIQANGRLTHLGECIFAAKPTIQEVDSGL